MHLCLFLHSLVLILSLTQIEVKDGEISLQKEIS